MIFDQAKGKGLRVSGSRLVLWIVGILDAADLTDHDLITYSSFLSPAGTRSPERRMSLLLTTHYECYFLS